MGQRVPTTNTEFEARDILFNHYVKLNNLFVALDDSSCNIMCGSLCCYFPKEDASVQIELELIPEIKRHLSLYNRNFTDCIRERIYSELSKELTDDLSKSEFVFIKDGIKTVYEVNTTNTVLARAEAYNLPRIVDGRRMWVNENSRPCAFLKEDKRCSLYAAGIRPMCCNAFICSTSLTLKLTKHLGYLTDDSISHLEFAELNSLTDNILEVFDESFMELESCYHDTLMELASVYAKGGDIVGSVSRFKQGEKEYLSRRRKLFESAINPGFIDYLKRLFS